MATEPQFGDVIYGYLDYERSPGDWLKIEAILVHPDTGQVRCVEVTAKDAAGVVNVLTAEQEESFKARFISAFYQRGF